MVSETVRDEVFKKFNDSCKNYLSLYVPDFRHCFIAGGCFPRLYHNLPVRDIDIYTTSDDAFVQYVREYKNISGWSLVKENRKYFRFKQDSSNLCVDLIGFHVPTIFEYIGVFDFTICRAYYTNLGLRVYNYHDFEHIMEKRLIFTGKSMYTENENNMLTRIRKYLDLGFTMSDTEMTRVYRYLTGPDAKRYTLEKGYV